MTAIVVRSLLFVPASRPDMFEKVDHCRPDAVVIDLEDAVGASEKDGARAAAVEQLNRSRPGAGIVLARINPPGTPWYQADLAAAFTDVVDGVVLPKYEHPDQLAAVRSALPTGATVIVGLETALGIADARALLEQRPDAAYFGAEDLVADLGGRRTELGMEVLYARSYVSIAARIAGVPAIDQAVVAIRDGDRFAAEAAGGRDLGYQGKICLHPLQVDAAHRAFTPTEAEVLHAKAVLSAAESGVGLVDGQMVDAVHVTMAQTILDRAAMP